MTTVQQSFSLAKYSWFPHVIGASLLVLTRAGDDDGKTKKYTFFTFVEVWQFMVYWVALWFAGKTTEAVRFPSLVGELIMGVLLGPNLANFVPKFDAVMMIGSVGLILEMVHVGLEVNLDILSAIGSRAFLVAMVGTAIPLMMGFGMATALGLDRYAAWTIGIALAPTAVGVTVKVLQRAGIMHKPMGQVIIAATVIDDLIAISLIGELSAFKKGTPIDYILPILSPVIGCLVIGYLALHYFPDIIQHHLLPRLHPAVRDNVLLILICFMTLGLTRAAYEAKGFYLVGAFLSGLCFSTSHEVHHVWNHQIKRIQYALLRVFYGGTIAFEVPVRTMWTKKIIGHGLCYSLCLFGKVAAGFTASPLTWRTWLQLGFALSVWGEITLLVGVTGKEQGYITKDDFAALVLATLISVILGPIALYMRLKYDRQHQKASNWLAENELAVTSTDGKKEYPHFLFYTLDISCKSKWGFLGQILRTAAEHHLDVIDFRVHGDHHAHKGGNDAVYELYLKDTIVLTPLDKAHAVHGDIDFTEQDAIEAAMAMEENFNSSLSDFRDGEIHVLNSLRETPLGSDNEDEDDNDNDSADVRKRGSLAPLMGDAIDLTKPENIVKDLTWQGQAITPGVSASTSVESIVSNVSEEMYQRKWQEGKPHIADVDEVRLRINDLKRAFLKEVVHDHRVTESIGVDLQLWRPPLDMDHPENDDEMATKFAEHVLHRIQFDKAGHGYSFQEEVHRVPFEHVRHEHLPPVITDLAEGEHSMRRPSATSRAHVHASNPMFHHRLGSTSVRPRRRASASSGTSGAGGTSGTQTPVGATMEEYKENDVLRALPADAPKVVTQDLFRNRSGSLSEVHI